VPIAIFHGFCQKQKGSLVKKIVAGGAAIERYPAAMDMC